MKGRLRRLFDRLVPSGSVLQRSIKGGIWTSITKVSVRFSQLLMVIVLARLLSPEDFGLMGIGLLTLSATRKFTKIGLNSALIQKKEDDVDDYLDTNWCLEVGRGVLLFSILFVAAPFIGDLFGEPRATTLIRVLGLVPIFHGLRNPAVVYFKKDMAFHKAFLYRITGGFTQILVGVGYGLYSPTVWALVFASLSRPASKTILSYFLDGYRPRPSLDVDAAKELIDYGKWLTGANMLGFLYREGDDAFVGWFLSATSLGFYQYAYRLADMPGSELASIVSGVTFPAFSKLQADADELRRALLKTTRFTAFFAYPISFGIVLIAPSFVPVVLGEKWTPMVPTMQILAFYGLAHASTSNFGEVWKALDRPDIITKVSTLRVICVAVLIWPATARWGIEGTALVVTGVYLFIMLPVDVYMTGRVTDTPTVMIYREFLYPFVAAATMFGSLWYARTLIDLSPLVELVLLVPAGVLVYAIVSLLLEQQFDWGIEQLFRTIVRGIE